MKVFAISDLHLSVNNPKPMDIFGPAWESYLEKILADWENKVSEEDIVLMAGDFSWAMSLEETKKDFEILKDLPGKKILIRGNHDYWWKSISAVRNFLPQNFYAIQNDCIKFDNVIICGTRGWTIPKDNETLTEENKKILNRELIRLDMTLNSAQKVRQENDKLICMLHFPPLSTKSSFAEFTDLLEKYKVDAVVYGHLHGYKNLPLKFLQNGIKYFLTSCDLTQNELVEIEV